MKQKHYTEKKRQLRLLVQKFHRLLSNDREDSKPLLDKLLLKIKKLVNELKHLLSEKELKKILGAVILFLGISLPDQAAAQSFAAPVQNPFGLVQTYYLAFPAFADLDNDGDMDLLVGEAYGKMQYFENTGTSDSPEFASPVLNPYGLTRTNDNAFPAFADLDSDGDIDLLVGEYFGNMQFFENSGSPESPQFEPPVKNPFGLIQSNYYFTFPAFADLDNDGDMDLFLGEYYGNLQFFENSGSPESPQFEPPVRNPFGLVQTDYFAWPAFADLDNDGDTDLLVGEYYGNLQFFENSGSSESPQFEPPVKNPFGLVQTNYFAFPAFADLDDDGDTDLLVGEYYGNVQYFENLLNVGLTPTVANFDLRVSPNPTRDKIVIDTDEKIERIEIYTITGESLRVIDKDLHSVSLEEFEPGMYLCK